MNYIAIFDRLTNKRLCFLENAYKIGYVFNLNGLHTATFTMPSGDTKNQYCKPLNYVEVWNNGERVELFRILPSKFTKNSSTKEIVYNCEHVLATLLDDVLFKFHSVGNTGTFTPTVIEYILSKQAMKRWNLQECSFQHQFLYTWENENLLSALFSVPNVFTEDYVWECDTTNMSAWQISLELRDTLTQKGELRYKKNMQGIVKSSDPTDLCTRMYLLGYGEGDNQLGIGSLNNNLPYIDSDTINQYGVISKIAVDRRFQDETNLLEYGKNLLKEVRIPRMTYEADAACITGLENVKVGNIIRVIDDEEGISELMPVTAISKSDVTGSPQIKLTIANKSEDIATSLADLSNRQRISDVYSQGSVNIDSVTFQDNADANNPATLRFYISSNVVRINAVNFVYSLTNFRAYSKAILGGGAQNLTSSNGGNSFVTSSSGGSSEKTTSSGGSSSETSSSDGQQLLQGSDVWFEDVRSEYSDGPGSHMHYLENFGLTIPDINVSPHSHEFDIPNHRHTVSIGNHSHDVSIQDHNHTVTLIDHTHEIEYGIYEGDSASSVTLKVDGVPLNAVVAPNQSFDLVKYLSVDTEGKIQRGTWHEIEIIPDTLTRIEASIQNIVFINPRGGQDL